MGVLIKNEFYKLKREWFMVFLLLLSLLPILTGGAGAVFNNSTKSLADLFFFMNNQFSMFFPMVIFILIGSLSSFYRKSRSASLSASASRPSYLSLLACLWRYSMEPAGCPEVFPCSSIWQSGLELKLVLSF